MRASRGRLRAPPAMSSAAAPSPAEETAALRAFYESSRVCMGVVELTDDGDILHLYDNPATARFFGLPPGTTGGRRARADLGVDPQVVAIWHERYGRSESTGAPVQFEYPVDGEAERW